jgi:parvulin-like peptidyl-prolyl isomerase
MNRKILLITVLIMGLLLAGCNSDGGKEQAKIIGEVNGDKISQAEFDQHLKILKITYEQQVLGGSGKLDESKDKETIDKLKEQAFKEMALQKILWQQAKERDIKISDSEVDKIMEQQDYKTFLEESGLDEKYFRQEMKTQILYWKLHDKVTARIKASDEEAQAYYKENISKYSEEGGIQISHILVDTEKEARDILAKLNGGADFADMARQYSTCPSKEQGGDLGLVNENKNFVPEFKEAALKLQPGEITKEPVKTEHGYHLIKAGDKKEARVKSFDEVKNSVMVDLNNEKKDKAYNDYLNNLYEKAEIKDLTK